MRHGRAPAPAKYTRWDKDLGTGRTSRLLCTGLYLQICMYKLVGADLYLQTRVYRLVGTDLYVQTPRYRFVCADSCVHARM